MQSSRPLYNSLTYGLELNKDLLQMSDFDLGSEAVSENPIEKQLASELEGCVRVRECPEPPR